MVGESPAIRAIFDLIDRVASTPATVLITGEGMPDQVIDRIFEPFFTTKGEDGNGLGLSIVRRIVQEHGGDIRIESRLGKGSNFILLLPFEDQRLHGPSSSTATNLQVAG